MRIRLPEIKYKLKSNKDMSTQWIYLVYRTDAWHSYNSRELVYIGENLDDIIAQLMAHREMTENDAEEIRERLQTQCNNRDYEWIVEEQRVNAFTD